jgi:hypothetical protein
LLFLPLELPLILPFLFIYIDFNVFNSLFKLATSGGLLGVGIFNPNRSDTYKYIKHKHWATKFKDVLCAFYTSRFIFFNKYQCVVSTLMVYTDNEVTMETTHNELLDVYHQETAFLQMDPIGSRPGIN